MSVFSKNVIKFKSPEQIHVSQSETTVEPSFGSTKVGCNANYIVLLTAAPTSFAKKYCFPFEKESSPKQINFQQLGQVRSPKSYHLVS